MSVDISKLNIALIIICGIVLFIIALLLFFVVLYRKSHNLFLKEKELIEIRHSQILLESQLEIQENIFTQISREIHDNIGQALSLVRLNINTLDFKNLEEKLSFTDELLGRAISDLRSLSHNLNTSFIQEAGLVEAIGQLLTSMEKTGQFTTVFCPNEIQIELNNEKTIILFRIVQEIMNNIVKHAGATKVEVFIENYENSKQIHIIDNGKGFDTRILIHPGNGMGISNMFSRARLIPAEVKISSTLQEGTRFTITI